MAAVVMQNNQMTMPVASPTNIRSIIEQDFRFAEKIRNLDERTALKIALALAGHNKDLFLSLHEIARTANLMPAPSLLSSLPSQKTANETPDQVPAKG